MQVTELHSDGDVQASPPFFGISQMPRTQVRPPHALVDPVPVETPGGLMHVPPGPQVPDAQPAWLLHFEPIGWVGTHAPAEQRSEPHSSLTTQLAPFALGATQTPPTQRSVVQSPGPAHTLPTLTPGEHEPATQWPPAHWIPDWHEAPSARDAAHGAPRGPGVGVGASDPDGDGDGDGEGDAPGC